MLWRWGIIRMWVRKRSWVADCSGQGWARVHPAPQVPVWVLTPPRETGQRPTQLPGLHATPQGRGFALRATESHWKVSQVVEWAALSLERPLCTKVGDWGETGGSWITRTRADEGLNQGSSSKDGEDFAHLWRVLASSAGRGGSGGRNQGYWLVSLIRNAAACCATGSGKLA